MVESLGNVLSRYGYVDAPIFVEAEYIAAVSYLGNKVAHTLGGIAQHMLLIILLGMLVFVAWLVENINVERPRANGVDVFLSGYNVKQWVCAELFQVNGVNLPEAETL